MATTTRRTRKSPSTTTRKSSETPTETPESDSQASEKASDETSTLKKSSSSPSSDDETEALFAEADADAAQKGQEDAQEPEGEKKPAKAAPEVPEGDVVTFEVDLPNISNYTFKGVVSGNTITVVEDATRIFRLPGSKKTGEVLAHHKGQLLPLSQFKSFIKE